MKQSKELDKQIDDQEKGIAGIKKGLYLCKVYI